MEYEQLKKNTVSAEKQLPPSKFVKVEEGSGVRVMFVGNSITIHGEAPQIGWHHNWGMAASAREKDYVHICMSHIREKDPEAAFCICHAAEWERAYEKGESTYHFYENARAFGADIIIMRLAENCVPDTCDPEVFLEEYTKLIRYLDLKGSARVIATSGFWKHPANQAIKRYAREIRGAFVDLEDLGELDEMKALGLFEHQGVCHHPGDLGMQTIAERILLALEGKG